MRQAWTTCVVAIFVIGIVICGWCAPPGEAVPATDNRGEQIRVLHQEIQTVLQSRETALRAFQAKCEKAPLADRVALEAEGAQLIEEYERAYLELLISYHQLTGNAVELARAEAMLERLNAGPITGTPLNLERNRPAPTTPAEPSPEGGIIHAQ